MSPYRLSCNRQTNLLSSSPNSICVMKTLSRSAPYSNTVFFTLNYCKYSCSFVVTARIDLTVSYLAIELNVLSKSIPTFWVYSEKVGIDWVYPFPMCFVLIQSIHFLLHGIQPQVSSAISMGAMKCCQVLLIFNHVVRSTRDTNANIWLSELFTSSTKCTVPNFW